MFNLDLAVHQWCARVLQNHSINSNKLEELKDHLYCEIETLTAQGMSEQEAFTHAIKSIGDSETLQSEYDKNRSWFNKLCAFEYGTIGEFSQASVSRDKTIKAYKTLQFSQAILWASAIIACSILLRDTPERFSTILLVLVSLSISSIFALKKIFAQLHK